ncbi:MAG: winged helix-turn-helix transcriptional regulator [Methanocorpusculum parvum]|nr:winged helix-turn-helix transcriptional regulator [Methanocorpusculum parvum]
MAKYWAICLIILIISFTCLPVQALDEVVHYPISGYTVIPVDSPFISDDTDNPIVEITEFQFSIPYILARIINFFNVGAVPVWAAETIVIIIGIITTIIGLITSGYLFFLYTRRKLSDNTDSRHMIILEYLQKHPGAQQTEIINATGFSRGSVSYNLKRLNQEMKIYKTKDSIAHYYTHDTYHTEKDRKAWKLLENESRMNIFQTIHDNPGISQRQLSKETGIPMTTLRWHLDKMVGEGLILVENHKNTTCYSVNPSFCEVYMTRLESETAVCE